MKLSIKAKRNIGLIVITLAVVLAVFLIIFFVNKAEKEKLENSRETSSYIGQLCKADDLDYKVFDNKKFQEFGDLKADEGNCFLLIGIELTAKKDITVKTKDFKVDDGIFAEATSEEYYILNEDKDIASGEKIVFYLLCEVESDRIESFYLHAYGYKIDLGGTGAIL